MGTVACITAYFNPAGYRNRRENYAAFAEALEAAGVPLLTVELAFGDDSYDLPESPDTLRLRGRSRLWMKERMINAAVSRLPARYTAFAWLDCDLVFADASWFGLLSEALEANDAVQLFERVVHLPPGHRRHRGEDEGSDPGLAAQAARWPASPATRGRRGGLSSATPGCTTARSSATATRSSPTASSTPTGSTTTRTRPHRPWPTTWPAGGGRTPAAHGPASATCR
jgi:hypothetical protein